MKTPLWILALTALRVALATANAQGISSATFKLLPAAPGVSGGAIQNEPGSVVIHSTTGDATGAAVSDGRASGYQLKPGYAGELYDIKTLSFAAVPDPVLENTTTQLTPGPATLDDDTTLSLEPSEIVWSIVSGPITAIDEHGIATEGPVDENTPATVEGAILNFTGRFDVIVGTEVAELVLSANIATGGTVTGGGFHSKGTVVPISAIPAGGYRFAGWIGDGVADPDATGTTVDLADDWNIVATFVKVWELMVAADPELGGNVTGAGTFDTGTLAPIAATAADGFRFTNWTGEGITAPDAANTTVEMSASRAVAAHFAPVAGDPVDFRILTITRLPDLRIAIEWSSVAGESYEVESAFLLDAPVWAGQGSVTATGPTAGLTTGVRPATEEYFRVRLVRE